MEAGEITSKIRIGGLCQFWKVNCMWENLENTVCLAHSVIVLVNSPNSEDLCFYK